jgi:tRNA pseudouridine32 synthase/23S rRNA pseudouridine746 synthase
MTSWTDIRPDRVLFEDSFILVIDKPPGIAVVGERGGLDVVRLAANAGETLLPVHRIDKVTSGAVVLAKQAAAHAFLTAQFAKRTVDKFYLAIVEGTETPDNGLIDLPLAVGRKNRVRIAADRNAITANGNRWSVAADQLRGDRTIYPSTTAFQRIHQGNGLSLLLVRPFTGRRHQIRVHLAWIGFPILGDPLFKSDAPRTFLHAFNLRLPDIAGVDRLDVWADPDDQFSAPVGGFTLTRRQWVAERERLSLAFPP